jgi:hypothetical protein
MNERNSQVYFAGSREVRRVPSGWLHPVDDRGRFIPLLSHDYVSNDGEPARTMPAPGSAIMAYETVSEGTPTSPAFPDTPEGRRDLVVWCAEHATTFGDHRADAEAWATILFGDAAVGLDGEVIAHD